MTSWKTGVFSVPGSTVDVFVRLSTASRSTGIWVSLEKASLLSRIQRNAWTSVLRSMRQPTELHVKVDLRS